MVNRRENPQAVPNLQALSRTTGGFSYQSESPEILKEGTAEISQDLNRSYRVEYTSSHTQRDGKLHKIEVKVRPGGDASKIKTYCRREYYAPSN
jgi:hypothetical protein